eukprot:NODE_700_length_4628_cov_1.474718.p5 type:complete len:144 gc:universal NODE_700_length_4628_cov_1.474718:1155-1586(+)
MDDTNVLISGLLVQLEDALKVNQSTIEELKKQMAIKNPQVDQVKEYEWTMEFMITCQRKMFKNYSETIGEIKKNYNANLSSASKEINFWKRKYDLEKKKNEDSLLLIEKIVSSTQKEFDDYHNMIGIYQTYTDNLVKQFNKNS